MGMDRISVDLMRLNLDRERMEMEGQERKETRGRSNGSTCRSSRG